MAQAHARRRGPSSAVRALLVAVVATASATAVHAGAGAPLPDLATLVALTCLMALGSEPLLRHQPSVARMTVLPAAGQAAVHLALTVLPHAPASAAGTGGLGGMEGMGGMEPSGGPLGAGSGTPWWSAAWSQMTLGHLLAAALVGLWLALGERAALHLLRVAAQPALSALDALVAPRPSLLVLDLTRTPPEVDLRPRCGAGGPAMAPVGLRGPPSPAVRDRAPPPDS